MVAKAIANYRDRGTHATNYENCGRKNIFDDRDLRSIRSMSIKRQWSTARDIHATLNASGDSCSYSTVKRALIEAGCKAIKPYRRLNLTAVHAKKRLEWARRHQNCTTDLSFSQTKHK